MGSDDRRSLYRELQIYLRNYIVEHRLQPGDKIPPASQLASDMGVSLASLREAIRALAALGVLETRHGVGTFVRAYDLSPILENLSYSLIFDRKSFHELVELREAMEVGLLGKVIESIKDQDLVALENVVKSMADPAKREESDRLFHKVMYRCMDNRLVTEIIEIFWDVVHRIGKQDPTILPPTYRREYNRTHQRILDAVRAKDVEKARSALCDHFDELRGGAGTEDGDQDTEPYPLWPAWPTHTTN